MHLNLKILEHRTAIVCSLCYLVPRKDYGGLLGMCVVVSQDWRLVVAPSPLLLKHLRHDTQRYGLAKLKSWQQNHSPSHRQSRTLQ